MVGGPRVVSQGFDILANYVKMSSANYISSSRLADGPTYMRLVRATIVKVPYVIP